MDQEWFIYADSQLPRHNAAAFRYRCEINFGREAVPSREPGRLPVCSPLVEPVWLCRGRDHPLSPLSAVHLARVEEALPMKAGAAAARSRAPPSMTVDLEALASTHRHPSFSTVASDASMQVTNGGPGGTALSRVYRNTKTIIERTGPAVRVALLKYSSAEEC